jgi:hypothetical protein
VGPDEQHRVHRLPCRIVAVRILRLLTGRNQSLSRFCAYCKTSFDAELYDLKTAAGISYSRPAMSKSVYEMHIGTFLVCKCERHFSNTCTKRITAVSVENNRQMRQNKSETVALACYTTLALNSVTVMNRTIVYRTLQLQMTRRTTWPGIPQ